MTVVIEHALGKTGFIDAAQKLFGHQLVGIHVVDVDRSGDSRQSD